MRLLLAMTCLSLLADAQGVCAQGITTGIVFSDANGNGKRDPGESGIAHVAVSNQDAVVATDSSGAFRLPRGGYGIVFVSVPDGYRSVGTFWRSIDDSVVRPLEFGLQATARTRDFTFVHASDTHISPASAERTRRLGTLVDSVHPAFLIITGDLVRDALRVNEAEATSYFDLFMRETGRFATPLHTVPGNHENFGIERHLSLVSPKHPLYGRRMYRHYLGPDYYSFDYGGVHFVGLNTIDIDDIWYYGHVDSLQLAWLERDLALVPRDMPVVTFDHIPFFTSVEALSGYRDAPPAPTLITVNGKTAFRHTVSNAGDVLSILRKHRHVLALGGHMHVYEHLEYEMEGVKTRFHQAAAVIGPTDETGFHFSSGITIYTVHAGEIDSGRFVPLGMSDKPRP